MDGGWHKTERIFTLQDLGAPLGTLPSGVLLLHTGRRPADSRALGPRWGEDLCLIPAKAEALAAAGLQWVTREGVAGVVLHPGGDADPARLALVFGLHLGAVRRRDPWPVRPCVACVGPPDLPGGHLVRLPHLLAIQLSSTSIEDHAVWEVMTATDARSWLGGPLPERGKRLFVEHNLPGLLELRSQARAGRLPAGDAGRRMAELLTRRYLSIRMAYQHIDLFLTLLADSAPERLA